MVCGCSHALNSSNIRIDGPNDELNNRNKSPDHKCDGGNRSLSAASLSPRLGDVLYTSVFLCISTGSLKDEELVRVGYFSQILKCSNCNAELGYCDRSNPNDNIKTENTLTFWDHSVIFTPNESFNKLKGKTPLNSIRKILDIAAKECGKPFIQISLQELAEEKRQLQIRLLEMNLSLLIAENHTDQRKLVVKKVIKVLYNIVSHDSDSFDNIDWTTCVGSDMFEAVLNSLNKNSNMIPQSQRYQKTQNGNISTISFNGSL